MNKIHLLDILSGKNVAQYYNYYNETKWYSEADMKSLQLDKLKILIDHCYLNVPYYARIMKEIGIVPSDIRTLDDMGLFPYLTKTIIKDHYNEFMPGNANKFRGIKHGQTGGTTGNSLLKRSDANTRSSVWGAYQRFYDWMGVNVDDWNVLLKGTHVLKPGFIDNIRQKISVNLTKTITIDAYRGPDENAKELEEVLRTHKIVFIKGYSQAIYEVAKVILDKGMQFRIKAVSTTAEPLFPEYREVLTQAFQAQVYDQYGCGEIGSLAFECGAHQGLHVTEERVLLEITNEHEVLLTDLDNYVMPFIRYWNADEVELSPHKCSCGRQSQLISKVRGRISDYLHGINGKKVHWGYIFHLLWDSKMALDRNFKKFQLVQVSSSELKFRHVSDPLNAADKQLIIDTTKDKLGNMCVTFIREEDIENSASGKYRWVVNQLLDSNISQ